MKKQILTKVVDKKDAAGRDHSKWSVNGEGQYNKQEIVQHTVLYVFGNLLKSMPLEKAVEYFNTTAKCTKAPLVVIDNAKYPKYKETVVSDGSSNYTVYAKDWLEPDEAPVFVEKVNANFVSLEAGNESDCKSKTALEYDSVFKHTKGDDEYLLVRKGNLWGKLDLDGNEILPCEYRYYILGIDYKHDEVFSIGDAKENLGLEEVTEDSINEYMEDNGYDGLIHLGGEKEVDTNHYITSVEGVELYPCDKGEEEWYKSIYDIEMQEIDIDDIEFEPADYDIADGVTIVAGWKTCSQYFELLIHDGEQFDPEQLLVCGKEKCAYADFDAIYQGIPLSLIGSTGDEDGDYYVSAALYADGEHICEDSDFLDDDEDEWD